MSWTMPARIRNMLSHAWQALWHQTDGPLARQLALVPGGPGLGHVPARRQHTETARLVCGFCSTGCGMLAHLRGGQAVGISPDPMYVVNRGTACPKGWEALAVLRAEDRATLPLLRDHAGRRRPIAWPMALEVFCGTIKRLQAHYGPHCVAFLSTGQIATEEMALLGSLAKFGMGLLHGDGNTRQCMATAVTAYKESFGFDAPPYTYGDLEDSDVIFLIGSNLCIAHPILWQRVLNNRHQPQIIVVDPRKTETAMAASLHLPLRPKSDLWLLYGIARLLMERGWIDQGYIARHTVGFEAFAAHVQSYTLQRVAVATGLKPALIEQAARAISQGERVSFWWTMGVNQSYEGVRTAQAIINLSLMTGNIGRPGTGANSITGQCNAMGSRMFSNTTNLLGGRSFENAEHRRAVADILRIDPALIPSQPSWAYDQIVEGILAGKIRGLWVIATNPAHSWINQHMLHDVLGRLEFLVVQDMYHTTETARLAHLLLPAAAWGEKQGTFINSERRVGLIQRVARPPGEALPDFHIFRLIAQAWGCGKLFSRWTHPEAAFEILQELSRGQPFDISGIRGYRMLAEQGGVQWPYPELPPDTRCERRLFADGRFYHPDGRARFVFAAPGEMPEPPSERYPLLLLTGRGTAAQWHTQTRTAKSPVLRTLAPRGVYVEINPADARRAGIRPSERVVVESQRGRLVAQAFVTHAVPQGCIFIPMHYPETNRLTLAHFDPYSRQPSYKNCAVRIRPYESHDRDVG